MLSRVRHKNLVALVGYCQEEGKQILIYEYMHSGSLHDQLRGKLSIHSCVNVVNFSNSDYAHFFSFSFFFFPTCIKDKSTFLELSQPFILLDTCEPEWKR